MASITMRKHKDGKRVFRFRVMVNGEVFCKTWPDKKDEQIPLTWSDKRAQNAADKQAALFESECKRGAVTNDKRTLAEYSNYVIDFKSSIGALRQRTAEGYILLMRRVSASRLGKMRLSDITAKDINTFYKELSENGQNKRTGGKLSAKTIHEYHVLIHAVLRQAVKEKIILFNPADNATPPKLKRSEAAYLTPEQIWDIVDALDNEQQFWRALTFLLIGSGMRRGEAVALKWSDVDFKNGRVRIARGIVRQRGGELVENETKTGIIRVISLPDEVIKELQAWRRLQSDLLGAVNLNGYIFSYGDIQKPISPDTVTQYFARFSKRHNLPHINPHAFRHTQTSVIVKTGDVAAASKRAGHSRISTTLNMYTEDLNPTDKHIAEYVGDVLFKRKEQY